MREGTPYLEMLRLRKHALIAESEVNRTKLLQEWHAISLGFTSLSRQGKRILSWVSVASLVAGSLFFLRKGRVAAEAGASQPLGWALKAVRMASPLLIALYRRLTRKE